MLIFGKGKQEKWPTCVQMLMQRRKRCHFSPFLWSWQQNAATASSSRRHSVEAANKPPLWPPPRGLHFFMQSFICSSPPMGQTQCWKGYLKSICSSAKSHAECIWWVRVVMHFLWLNFSPPTALRFCISCVCFFIVHHCLLPHTQP